MRYLLLLIFLSLGACTHHAPTNELTAIQEVMDRQADDWNAGDLEGFMQGYWRSDSLRFVSTNGITYGWQATLDRYRQRYPDAATRGALRFEVVSTELLSDASAFMVGRFFLTRPQKGDTSGYFTLLWRKIDGKWVIVVDHTG